MLARRKILKTIANFKIGSGVYEVYSLIPINSTQVVYEMKVNTLVGFAKIKFPFVEITMQGPSHDNG